MEANNVDAHLLEWSDQVPSATAHIKNWPEALPSDPCGKIPVDVFSEGIPLKCAGLSAGRVYVVVNRHRSWSYCRHPPVLQLRTSLPRFVPVPVIAGGRPDCQCDRCRDRAVGACLGVGASDSCHHGRKQQGPDAVAGELHRLVVSPRF